MLFAKNWPGWYISLAERDVRNMVSLSPKALKIMAKVCPVTKKSSQISGHYSNRVRATKYNPTGNTRRYANLQKKRIFIPELNRTITLTLSTAALRTITKNGAYATLKKAGVI